MKDMKNIIKLVVGGVLIFVLGLYMGSELDFTSLSSIEGYLYGANTATPSDATSGNATSANATSGNATSGNATSGNATSANATSANATSGNSSSSHSSSGSSSNSGSVGNNSTAPTTTSKEVLDLDLTSFVLDNYYVNLMKNSAEGSKFKIKAYSNAIIKSDVFDAIKGSNKTLTVISGENEMVFNGLDIKTSKDIDPSINVSESKEDAKIKENVSKGIVVTFADNGVLPGTATVRIKNYNYIDELLNDKVNVYYYNETDDKYVLIDDNVQLVNGYYEFKITHNSKYVMVNDRIADAEVEVDGKTKVSFQKSKTVQLLLIGCGVVVIIGAIVAIVIVKKKKGNKTNQDGESNQDNQTPVGEFPWDKEQK